MAACGHAPTTTVAPSSRIEAPVVPIEGPFTPVGGTRIRFAREYIEATLPPRTRLGSEDAYVKVGVFGIDDELHAAHELMHYEYENCVFTVRASDTLLRSPPEIFDDTRRTEALARLSATATPTADTSMWMVRRSEGDLPLALLERDGFAMRVSASAMPLRSETIDDDPSNDFIDEETMRAAAAACDVRGEAWMTTLTSTLRDVRTERTPERAIENVRIPGPDGHDYEVRIPEGHDVAVRDWYHGVEVEIRPRTFYGAPACASVWVATANSPTGFEEASRDAPSRTILGRRIRIADVGFEGPENCTRRVGVVPAGRRGIEWVVSLLGADDGITQVLEALARARRAR